MVPRNRLFNSMSFACSDAKHMATDVHDIFFEILKEQGKKTDAEAHDFLKMLGSKKRYQQDVWS